MDAYQRRALVEMLLQSGAVRFGDFTLTSGQKSDVYVDIKHAWTDPKRLALIADALAEHVEAEDQLAGMELGAVPLVVATALKTGRPYAVVRKATKAHGTGKRIEGELPPNVPVLVIEDVATTGGSLVQTVEVLREAGARVDRAVVVVDRGAGATTLLKERGVRLGALVTFEELRGATT
ncbi:MAG: orotate phosphoribosyltransferase [Thermoplasmata archaeon]